jgi:acetyl esterase/lipase
MPPLPADKPGSASRRTLLAGLTAMLTTGCSRLEFMAANVPAAFGAYERHSNIPYGTDRQQRLDVYVPKEVPPEQRRPLTVFWHGGRWSSGDKADYRFVGAALAGLGYVAVLPNYRHYDQVKMPGFMDDTARAAQWAAAHGGEYGADANRLYLMGHSSGAHMAALAALDSRYFAATGQAVPQVAGVIGLSGPYDFLPLREADVQDMFGPPQNYPDSQPVNFVRTDSPPMLLVHGLMDTTVSPENSRSLAAALRAHGVPVALKLYPNLAHADTVAALSLPARGRAPTLADIAGFVKQPLSFGFPDDQAALAAAGTGIA